MDQIQSLMRQYVDTLNFEQFIDFSFNTDAKNDNPEAIFDRGYANTYQDNSILRTFNSHPDRKDPHYPNSDQGVSTIVIELPQDSQKPVRLYLRIIDSVQDRHDSEDTQQIFYTEATTTLSQAMHYPQKIEYHKKSCVRMKNSEQCLVKAGE